MEQRIRTLYVITIIAILAFLGMQAYWLYSRYEYSLTEHENAINTQLLALIEQYADIRRNDAKNVKADYVDQSNYNMEMIDNATDDDDTLKRMVTITSYSMKAQDILQLPPEHVLTAEEKQQAIDLVLSKTREELVQDSKVFDASNAPSDAAVWGAARSVELERKSPFTVAGIDSVLANGGVIAETRLFKTDSMMWQPEFVRHQSTISPEIRLIYPYSELECKAVEITCRIRPGDVMASMLGTLVMAGVLSVMLIICLIWQFATILKQNRMDRMRNDFVTSMIHELKRPLSTLKMCVSGIENDGMMADRDVKRELMTETRGALDNLSAYFSKLRDITFNNVEQIPLNTTQFPLLPLLGEVKAHTACPVDKMVEIRVDCPDDVLLTADRVHLSNILGNLVENSVKYSGDRVEVTLSVKVTDADVAIAVTDNGHGMSPADSRRVFDRFFRSRNAADSGQPGMGLGLAYAKLLVEAHGGTIQVGSREGEGSCFTIILPQ